MGRIYLSGWNEKWINEKVQRDGDKWMSAAVTVGVWRRAERMSLAH